MTNSNQIIPLHNHYANHANQQYQSTNERYQDIPRQRLRQQTICTHLMTNTNSYMYCEWNSLETGILYVLPANSP
jgi:hypothetical protein